VDEPDVGLDVDAQVGLAVDAYRREALRRDVLAVWEGIAVHCSHSATLSVIRVGRRGWVVIRAAGARRSRR